ncbi:MAG: VOC family protein [Proteobacteria bacterium]|nr:VOC family protein [Pseudomonadota bacterium]MBS0493600.1 VOC family protein [Pseudomonadota bacterium]
MSSSAKTKRATVVPCLRYRDAPKAIEWLCSVFGFEKHLVVPNDDGTIAHAQLSFGNGMVMLGSATKAQNAFDRLIQLPDALGGVETQSPYLVVADADLVYQRVMAAGGKIEMAIKDEDYGGRGFCCRDLEGHLWSIGTYDPW